MVGRYVRASGQPGPGAVLKAITGGPHRQLSLTLPSRLEWLRQNVPALAGTSIEAMVERFTIAPLYRPFLGPGSQHLGSQHEVSPGSGWEQVVTQLAGTGTREARMLLGIARGGGDQRQPVHCPACLEEQVRRSGVGTWPLVFLLPQVAACPIHGVRLQAIRPASNIHLGSYTFLGAPTIANAQAAVVADLDARRFAQLTIELYQANRRTIEPSTLALVYRTRLHELGLVEPGGRVRHDQLNDRIQAQWGALFPHALRDPRWLYDMYRLDATRSRGPTYQTILIGALFGSISEWLVALDKLEPAPSEGLRCTSQRQASSPGTRYVQLQHWLNLIPRARKPSSSLPFTAYLLRGMPVRMVAARTGFSRFAVYRFLRAQPDITKQWALEALRTEFTKRLRSRDCGPSPATRKWLSRHRNAVELLSPPARGEAQR